MWGILAPVEKPVTQQLLAQLREAGFSKLVLLTDGSHPHNALQTEEGMTLQIQRSAFASMHPVSIAAIVGALQDLRKGAGGFFAIEGILVYGFSISENSMINYFTGNVRVRVVYTRADSIEII